MKHTISITIYGKVQGVYFRHHAKEKAHELEIRGEVKNLRDGNVYILATGTREQLDIFINWCKKGPYRAEVTKWEVSEMPLQEFDDFRIIRN